MAKKHDSATRSEQLHRLVLSVFVTLLSPVFSQLSCLETPKGSWGRVMHVIEDNSRHFDVFMPTSHTDIYPWPMKIQDKSLPVAIFGNATISWSLVASAYPSTIILIDSY